MDMGEFRDSGCWVGLGARDAYSDDWTIDRQTMHVCMRVWVLCLFFPVSLEKGLVCTGGGLESEESSNKSSSRGRSA